MPSLPETAVCLHCGYSLRGLPENVCPECGRGFEPEDRTTWWNECWPRTIRIWRRWLGPLPLWHKVLMMASTVVLLDFLSYWPYRRRYDFGRIENVGSTALLIGLVLSYLLRKKAAQVCFTHGWIPPGGESAMVCRSRIVEVCAILIPFAVLFAPFSMSLRVALSMPFLEYKSRQINAVGRSDNHPQILGLFLVERVGRLGDGGIKLQSYRGWYGAEEGLIYYSWKSPTPPEKRTGLTRWYWMGG